MKREKRLTKREKKAISGGGQPHEHNHEQHIHCVACGRHLDAVEFEDPSTAKVIACQHGSRFPSCVGCETRTKALLAEHDRTGQPVKTASAWH